MRGGRRVLRRRAALIGALGVFGAGACAEIIGADFGRYSPDDEGSALEDAGEASGGDSAEGGGNGSGGRGGAGTIGAGGRVQPGGSGGLVVGSGGTAIGAGGTPVGSGGALGSGGGPGCPAGQKECSGLGCMAPNPSIGCGLTGCTSCPPAPASGYSYCLGTQCAFDCYVGFTRNAAGDGCEPELGGTGGVNGSGGASSNGGSVGSTGGAATTCLPASCPACSSAVFGPYKCCRPNDTCGCSWISSGAACT